MQQTLPQLLPQNAPSSYEVDLNMKTSGSTEATFPQTGDQQNNVEEMKPEVGVNKPLIETAVELTGEEDIGLTGQVADDPENWQTFDKWWYEKR